MFGDGVYVCVVLCTLVCAKVIVMSAKAVHFYQFWVALSDWHREDTDWDSEEIA